MEECPFIYLFLNPEMFISIVLVWQKYSEFFGKATVFLFLFVLIQLAPIDVHSNILVLHSSFVQWIPAIVTESQLSLNN